MNNPRFWLFGMTSTLAVVLTGCAIESGMKARETRQSAVHSIQNAPSWTREAAVYTTAPPPALVPILPPAGPEWLHQRVSLHLSDMPFDMAVERVLGGTGVVPRFDYDTNPSLPVTLLHDGTILGALEKLAARTNYGFTPCGNSVDWQAYMTRSWTLPIAGGDYSYMIGKSDQGSRGGSQGGGGEQSALDTSAFDVDLQQFSNTQAERLNYLDDAHEAIIQIVGNYGVVSVSRSTSSVMVRTTPDRMRNVELFMEGMMSELLSQVLLEVKVIQVTTSTAGETGLNWAAIKNQTSSQLQFMGDSAFGAFTSAVPVGFASTNTTSSGSVDVLVQAMEQQGNVSFLTEQRVLTRSGKQAELELADIRAYLARSQVTNTTDVGSSRELIPGFIQAGYTLYTYNRVFGNRVAIVVSNRSSDLEPFEQVGNEDNFIQLPSMSSNRLNVHQIVRDGTTVVAAAIRREETATRSNSPLSARFLPSYRGSQTSVTEIYVLITPRIILDI